MVEDFAIRELCRYPDYIHFPNNLCQSLQYNENECYLKQYQIHCHHSVSTLPHPVIKITVGHRSWLTRFPIWLNSLFLKFVEITDYWMRLFGLRSVTNCMCLTWRKRKGLFIEYCLCTQQNFILKKQPST